MPSTHTCSRCGAVKFRGPGSRPEGQFVCLECRRANPAPNVHEYPDRYALSCEGCGQEFRAAHRWRRFCSVPCANRALHPTYRPASHHQVKRRTLEVAAPGLGARARSRLLARWKRQGRRCAYCPSLAATVDHVVPLCAGGTNFEGNLVPACRRCNSSKSGLLLVEWRARTGRLSWLSDESLRILISSTERPGTGRAAGARRAVLATTSA